MRIFFLTIIVGLAIACSRNVGEPPENQWPEAAFIVHLALSDDVPTNHPTSDVLYLGARPAAGGPPVFVARRTAGRFPETFFLTDEDRMGMGGDAGGPMIVFARWDSDGDAGTAAPGDWAATAASAAVPGNTHIDLTLAPLSTEPAFEYVVAIDGPPAPPDSVMFVLLRQADGRMPLVAGKFAAPAEFPIEISLTDRNILQGPLPDLAKLEVVVKIDQDGNPVSTSPGDLHGRAPAADARVTLRPEPGDTGQ